MKQKIKIMSVVFGISIMSLMLFGCYSNNLTSNNSDEQRTALFGATVGNLTTEDQVITPSELTKELAKFTPNTKKEEYKYAVFHIPMFTSKHIEQSNTDGYYEPTSYNKAYHIELKATTNNFGNADWYSGEDTAKRDVLYVAHTRLNDMTKFEDPDSEYYVDTCQIFIKGYMDGWAYYFSGERSDNSQDVIYDGRGYVKISSTENTYESELKYVPEYLTIVVGIENFRRGQGSSWFSPENEDLNWCFLRYNSYGEYIGATTEDINLPLWV